MQSTRRTPLIHEWAIYGVMPIWKEDRIRRAHDLCPSNPVATRTPPPAVVSPPTGQDKPSILGRFSFSPFAHRDVQPVDRSFWPDAIRSKSFRPLERTVSTTPFFIDHSVQNRPCPYSHTALHDQPSDPVQLAVVSRRVQTHSAI